MVPSPGSTAVIFRPTITIIARGGGISLASSRQTHIANTSRVATPRGAIPIKNCTVIRTAAISCTTITTTAKDSASKRLGFVQDMQKTLSSKNVLPLLVLQFQITIVTPYAESMNDERMVE
jgi:hypothetical protein